MSYNMNKLPQDIIHYILKYDGTMTYRNGKYMNKILDPDKNYPLIVERMRFQRYRRFLSTISFVTIHITTPNFSGDKVAYEVSSEEAESPLPTTEKEICYWATNDGLKISLIEVDYDNHMNFVQNTILFCNR